jgi:hypothetical protein
MFASEPVEAFVEIYISISNKFIGRFDQYIDDTLSGRATITAVARVALEINLGLKSEQA